MEEKLSLQEFHDLEEITNEEEEEADNEAEAEEEDIEKGMNGKGYHFSPSLIKKRGVSNLHQVSYCFTSFLISNV